MFLYALQINVIVHLIVVALQIESNLLRVLPEMPFVQMVLMLEEHVVKRPEASLSAGRFGRFRGHFGARMNPDLREMPEYEPNALGKTAEDDLDGGVRLPTGRALEVAVL